MRVVRKHGKFSIYDLNRKQGKFVGFGTTMKLGKIILHADSANHSNHNPNDLWLTLQGGSSSTSHRDIISELRSISSSSSKHVKKGGFFS